MKMVKKAGNPEYIWQK